MQSGILPWVSTFTYPQYGLVLGADGYIYQSLQNSNTNNDPTAPSSLFWENYVTPAWTFGGNDTTGFVKFSNNQVSIGNLFNLSPPNPSTKELKSASSLQDKVRIKKKSRSLIFFIKLKLTVSKYFYLGFNGKSERDDS
jgi:hypothetical protein